MTDVGPQIQDAPVEELHMGVVLQPITKFGGPFAGIFWQQIKDQFPDLSTAPYIPAMIEQLDQPFYGQRMPVLVGIGQPMERYVLSDHARRNSVQIQRDLLVRSWMRRGPSDRYPEYDPRLRKAFEDEWGRLVAFAAQFELGSVVARQCEMTYINVIPRGAGWDDFSDLSEVFRPWCGCTEHLPGIESATMQMSVAMNDARGRVVVTVTPTRRAWDRAESISMTISSRVVVEAPEPGQAIESMDVAHRWARKVFEGVTTQGIRKRWKGD